MATTGTNDLIAVAITEVRRVDAENAKWLRLAWALFNANVDEQSCPYCEKQTRKGEHDAGCELNALWLMIDEVDPT